MEAFAKKSRVLAQWRKKRRYQRRVFNGRTIESDEIERIHKALEFEQIDAISDPIRELIEDLWPELVHKLTPKKPRG